MARVAGVAEAMVAEIAAPRSDVPRMLEALLAQLLLLLDRGLGVASVPPSPAGMFDRLTQLVEARFLYNHRVSFYARTLGSAPRSLEAIFYSDVPLRGLGRVTDADVLPSVLGLPGLKAPSGLQGRSVWK